MKVISASRRTDIPAFFGDWFLNRIKAGFAQYPNPMSGKACTVSLRKEDVLCFIFWSKNFGPFLSGMEELRSLGYDFYCHYTITGLGTEYEPKVPDQSKSLEYFKQMSRLYGAKSVLWRFDPILLNQTIGPEETRKRFLSLANSLEGYTHRCYISFAQYYTKIRKLYQDKEKGIVDPSAAEKLQLARELAVIAAERGIALYSCCTPGLAGPFSGGEIFPGRCIDPQLIKQPFPHKPADLKAGPTRQGCGCADSRDIGVYDTCPHHCAYCYANSRFSQADENWSSHKSDDPALLPIKKELTEENSSQLELF